MNKRIHNRLPVAREGFVFIALGVFLTGLSLVLSFYFPALLLGCLTLFTIYFFRDPARTPEVHEMGLLTPADGKIVEVTPSEYPSESKGERAFKVSVFMSILDVHVNRMPAGGRVSEVKYHPGKFLVASLNKASEQNERNAVTLDTHDGRRVVIVQVAGMIARRIACWVNQGDEVEAGQRFGLIRFGSRLDVYLPADSRITAEPGQKVRAGETVIGYLS
ncbi:MAG: phosphatidylserine decarboxylase family protein [Deltaproteobacteria bacterium]|nr:phosphatidylserine decarboxylase family protein [Deltaproteobacteria bacterium]